jgi:excisionase family DNA binding protein
VRRFNLSAAEGQHSSDCAARLGSVKALAALDPLGGLAALTEASGSPTWQLCVGPGMSRPAGFKTADPGASMSSVAINMASSEMEDFGELLTVDEVAALLKVSRSWVYEHTRSAGRSQSERLPHIKLGKYVRFHPQAVQTFLRRSTKR